VTFENKLGKLEILKEDEDGEALAGSTFTITPNPKTGVTGSSLVVVDDGSNDEANTTPGTLLVTGCKLNIEYTITETGVPDGYEGAAAQKKTLTSSVKVTVTFENKLGKLEILKVDESGVALFGATFTITPNPKTGNDSLEVVDNGLNDESNVEGKLLVTGCKLNITYTISETVVPEGYEGAEDQTRTLTSSAKVTLSFENRLGELEILKQDATKNLLAGATFTITPNPQTGIDSLEVVDNGLNDESNVEGKLLVTGCKLNIEYTISETVVPEGYKGAEDQTVTLTSSARMTLTFVNTMGKIEIIKRDKLTGDVIHIPGVSFSIHPNPYGSVPATLVVLDNGPYDKNDAFGYIELVNIPLGIEYTIIEVSAPHGYKVDPTPQTRTPDEDNTDVVVTSEDERIKVPGASNWSIGLMIAGLAGAMLFLAARRNAKQKSG